MTLKAVILRMALPMHLPSPMLMPQLPAETKPMQAMTTRVLLAETLPKPQPQRQPLLPTLPPPIAPPTVVPTAPPTALPTTPPSRLPRRRASRESPPHA